jgi:hypothetical protein
MLAVVPSPFRNWGLGIVFVWLYTALSRRFGRVSPPFIVFMYYNSIGLLGFQEFYKIFANSLQNEAKPASALGRINFYVHDLQTRTRHQPAPAWRG